MKKVQDYLHWTPAYPNKFLQSKFYMNRKTNVLKSQILSEEGNAGEELQNQNELHLITGKQKLLP